jgi:hypothetical protein
LDLIQRGWLGCRHGPHEGRPVGRHLTDTKGAPPEWDDPPRVVLVTDGRQINPSAAEPGQDDPVFLEQLLLLHRRRPVAPPPRRRGNGSAGVLWQRVLGVVLEVEPTLVSAVVGACPREGDVHLPLPCFIRTLAHSIVTGIWPSFRQANLKKYRNRCQWAPIPRYPSRNASNPASY